jgi:hypothetical protein
METADMAAVIIKSKALTGSLQGQSDEPYIHQMIQKVLKP